MGQGEHLGEGEQGLAQDREAVWGVTKFPDKGHPPRHWPDESWSGLGMCSLGLENGVRLAEAMAEGSLLPKKQYDFFPGLTIYLEVLPWK